MSKYLKKFLDISEHQTDILDTVEDESSVSTVSVSDQRVLENSVDFTVSRMSAGDLPISEHFVSDESEISVADNELFSRQQDTEKLPEMPNQVTDILDTTIGVEKNQSLDWWLDKLNLCTSRQEVFSLLDRFRPLPWPDHHRAEMSRAYIGRLNAIGLRGDCN